MSEEIKRTSPNDSNSSSGEKELEPQEPASAPPGATSSPAAAKGSASTAAQKEMPPPPPTETKSGIPPIDPAEPLPPRGLAMGMRVIALALLFTLALSLIGEWIIHRVIVGSKLGVVTTVCPQDENR